MGRLLRHIRKTLQLQPGKPAIGIGVRAAVAVTVPYALASLARMPEASWTGLSGLLVTLADRGGSYPGRARAMAEVALLGAMIGAIAAPLGGTLVLDAVLLMIGVTACSFVRCYGESAGSTGEKMAVFFVASLGSHEVGAHLAVARGVALLFGGMWALLQGLVLWPVHPYLPARKAMADLYRSLSQGARELAELSRRGASSDEWTDALKRYNILRPKLDHARETLGVVRAGRSDEARRGEHLLVLLELAERMMAALFALAHAMEIASPEPHLTPVREHVAHACDGYARTAEDVAKVARDPNRAVVHDGERKESPESPFDEELLRRVPPSVSELLGRLRGETSAAVAAARAMRERRPVPFEAPPPLPVPPEKRRLRVEPIKDNLSRDSVVLRHAIRAGLVSTAALVVTRMMHLGEPFWVVLSVLNILQPYSASTEQRALQRVTGTLLGGLLAASLAAWIGSQLWLTVVIGVLTAVSVSLLALNFGLFQILLTPDFLLLATLNVGDWHVAEGRAEGVMIACGLALAGAWLLWPSPERRRFPEAAANLLRADGHYFRKMAERRSGFEPDVAAARREFGLALLDAEASFDRLVAEYRGPAQHLEPAMALLTYSRRLAASVTALGAHKEAVEKTDVLEKVSDRTVGTLDTLADSLREAKPPPPLQPLEARSIDDPVSGRLVERVPRQLEILHGAVARLTVEAQAAM